MAKPYWLNIDPISGAGGQKISVSSEINDSGVSRSGSFIIKTTSGIEKEISVTQQAAPEYTVSGSITFKNSTSITIDKTLYLSIGVGENLVQKQIIDFMGGTVTSGTSQTVSVNTRFYSAFDTYTNWWINRMPSSSVQYAKVNLLLNGYSLSASELTLNEKITVPERTLSSQSVSISGTIEFF